MSEVLTDVVIYSAALMCLLTESSHGRRVKQAHLGLFVSGLFSIEKIIETLKL